MRYFLPVLIFGASAYALSAQSFPALVQVVRGTAVDRLGSVWANSNTTPAMFHQLSLLISLPRGGRLNGRLLVVYDTVSNRFGWNLQNAGEHWAGSDSAEWFAEHAAAYVGVDRVVLFWETTPGQLFIVERLSLSASSLEEAQNKAINEIANHTADIERGGEYLRLGGTTVPLPTSRVPHEFWFDRLQAHVSYGRTRITSVQKEQTGWRLVLRDHWDQELILDEFYSFVSTRRLTAAGGIGQ
jgi:hypothetical protein